MKIFRLLRCVFLFLATVITYPIAAESWWSWVSSIPDLRFKIPVIGYLLMDNRQKAVYTYHNEIKTLKRGQAQEKKCLMMGKDLKELGEEVEFFKKYPDLQREHTRLTNDNKNLTQEVQSTAKEIGSILSRLPLNVPLDTIPCVGKKKKALEEAIEIRKFALGLENIWIPYPESTQNRMESLQACSCITNMRKNIEYVMSKVEALPDDATRRAHIVNNLHGLQSELSHLNRQIATHRAIDETK